MPGETRDVARLIAAEHDLTIPDLELLDAAIAEHFPWADEAESSGAPGDT